MYWFLCYLWALHGLWDTEPGVVRRWFVCILQHILSFVVAWGSVTWGFKGIVLNCTLCVIWWLTLRRGIALHFALVSFLFVSQSKAGSMIGGCPCDFRWSKRIFFRKAGKNTDNNVFRLLINHISLCIICLNPKLMTVLKEVYGYNFQEITNLVLVSVK